ncbi:g101 [Coccomyxa elongata]
MGSFTASWVLGSSSQLNPLLTFRKNKLLRTRKLHRGCLASVSTSSAGVSTTIHKDGTVTYHFSGGVLPEDAVFSKFTGPTEVLEVPEGPVKASDAEEYKNVANGVSGSEVAPPELAALSGVHPSSFVNELNGNSHKSPHTFLNGAKQLETAQNGAHHSNGTADRNGYAKNLNGSSANALLQLDAPILLGPRQEQDRSRQHQRAGFSGRFTEAPTRNDWHQLPRGGNGEHVKPREGQTLSVAKVLERMADVSAIKTLQLFSDLARDGELDAALEIVEAAVRAKRDDILGRVRHSHFLREAADQACGPKRRHATKLAMRFVQVLPRKFTDARTYNMLVSVCVKAKDLTNALHAADMLRSTGRKLDTILYTNLISVCAAVGNADAAFELYAAMKAEGVKTEAQVYTSLISACSREILKISPDNRRLQLVLLERARGVLAEMRKSALRPDAFLYNALITAAGRAGQVQGAFQTLEDMQGSGCKADQHTFASLIDACARAGRADMAIRVYHKALRERCNAALLVYASAIASCRAAKPVDLVTAMDIYSDMQRNGVQADECLYATLMGVAGAAGQLELAFNLQDEMVLDGIQPSKLSQSTLIQACIDCGSLERARQVYAAMGEQGRAPSLQAMNNLINAHSRACRLGDVVSLVEDLVAAGMRPDAFTFAAILNACQRANEAELAFDVYRMMKQRGHVVDEAVCFILVRLCYNQLRDSWYPGGYPPKRSSVKGGRLGRNPAGPALLRALGGSGSISDHNGPAAVGESVWAQRAVDVYREALSAGYRPRRHVIERVLACLRHPQAPKNATTPAAFAAPFQAGSYGAAEGHDLAEAMLQSNSRDPAKIFDGRAVAILEEAISLGALPQFSLANAQPLDLRYVPPCIAEVYVLAIVAAMQRGAEPNKESDLIILVPPYDPAEIFSPSYGHDEVAHKEAAATPSLRSARGKEQRRMAEESAGESEQRALSQTGLGVAGMLRRIGLWATEDAIAGRITLAGRELVRWLRAADRAASSVRNASLSTIALQEQKWIGGSIMNQQKSIRMGLNGSAPRGRHRQPGLRNPQAPKLAQN